MSVEVKILLGLFVSLSIWKTYIGDRNNTKAKMFPAVDKWVLIKNGAHITCP